jgi:hypothetical protein
MCLKLKVEISRTHQAPARCANFDNFVPKTADMLVKLSHLGDYLR